MVRQGAFGPEFKGRSIARLYWIALSRTERGDPITSAVEQNLSPDDVAERVMQKLEQTIAKFDDPATGYISKARQVETRYPNPFDHLARVREWSLVESPEEISWLNLPRP